MTTPAHPDMTRGYVTAHGVSQLLFWSAFYYLLPALSAQIVSETDWPLLHVSTTYTAAFLVWAAFAPVVGLLIDAGHGAKVMRLGALAGIALLLALSQITDKTMFTLLVVLLGLCMAMTLYDPCFAMILRRLKTNGAQGVARVTLIAGFATLLTFPLIYLLTHVMDWQQSILVFATLAMLGVILLPREDGETEQVSAPQSSFKFSKAPALIAMSFGLVMMAHAIFLFLLPVALARSQGVANVGFLALAILGPAQIFGRLAWSKYGVRFGLHACALVMFTCLCFPAILLLLFGAKLSVICIALIIQGACYGVHTILRPTLSQFYLPPAHLGRGLGAIALVGVLFMATGPAFGGVVWTFGGLTGLMVAVLTLNILALLIGVALSTSQPKDAML